MANNNSKIKSILYFFGAILLVTSKSILAQTCPAGFSSDTLVWSDLWDPAFDATTGTQTVTTPNGIDITISFDVTGPGCTDADFTASGFPAIAAGSLVLFPDWPNTDCSVDMTLDFSVGAPIDVQEVQFTAQDVDQGGFDDQVIFNGATSVTTGADIIPIANGGHGNVGCGIADPDCFVTGTWSSPVSNVSLTYSPGPQSVPDPGAQLILLSNVDFCFPDTVPVTLGSFKSDRLGNRVTAKWETLSESFNLGFTLWGEVAGEWVALSDRMIRSKKTDTATTSRYRSRVNVSQFDEEITAIGISSVDTNGTEEFYGPFEIGKKYGIDSLSEVIEWQPIRDAYERKLQAAGYQAVGNRWRQLSSDGQGIKSVSVSVPESGIYRITHEDLLARGVDFSGVSEDEIAVSFQGKPVPRDILKTGRIRQFNANSSIVFHGAAPSGSDALYLDNLVYQISREPALVANVGRVRGRLSNDADLQTLGRVTQHIEEDKFYDEIVSSDDPWMMDELFVSANSETSQTYEFEFNGEVTGDNVDLFLQLNSITDFDAIDQDGDGNIDDEHHVRVIVNEQDSAQLVIDETNDGTQSWQLNAQFSDSVLKTGTNTITVQLVGDTGYDFSLVYIDSISVTASEKIIAGENVVKFVGTPQEGGFQIDSVIRGRLYGYAYTDDGNLARIRVRRQRIDNENQDRVLQVSGISEVDLVANYWVANEQGFLSPDGIWTNEQPSIDLDKQAGYLIVIDPALVGDDIQRFIQFREESGFDIMMVTVDDIVDEFGYGMKTPEAFSKFLKIAQPTVGFSHVLLVGGHTYDYLNRLEASAPPVNMIPTFYRRSNNLINFSPTDLPFVDFDGTGKPNAAIGRWPVRTAEELVTVIDKTIAYEKQGGMADAQSALLIAERNGGGLENFSAQLDRVQPFIGVTTSDGSVVPWTNVSRVDVDEIEQQGFSQGTEANTEARRLLKEGIDAGQSLTIFAGHGSPTSWSNQNLFVWNNITELENFNDPTQVATLACYTTYYQSPSTNSLAHQFLFDEAGAVSINGAAVLGSIRGNEILLNNALTYMMQGQTMGEAIMQAKQEMIDQQQFVDTVLTWVTLGDPALTMRQ